MKKFVTITGLILALVLTGCEGKWKKPTSVNIAFETTGNFAKKETFTLTEGTLFLQEINIKGDRKQGDDIDFLSDETVGIDLVSGQSQSPVSFDVPQGTYRSIQLHLKPLNGGNEAVIIQGNYTTTIAIQQGPETIYQTQIYPVEIEVNINDVFKIRVKENDGTDEIVLVEDQPRDMTILIDISYWFDAVTAEMWDASQFTDISGKPTILIDQENNTSIYNTIANRIGDSISGNFD